MTKELTIRNSTAEFLIFQSQSREDSIEVKYADGNVWLTQKMIAKLFDKGRSTITEHLKEIYKEGELDQNATCRKFRQIQTEGHRNIERDVEFYNLDAIISVGYRVNSQRATQFRIWATNVLRQFAIKGYVLDKKRLENAGKITMKIAKEFAESEFEKYRIVQDKLFESDFDKVTKSY